ncbi:MAG: molybdenum cofactor synthesis domain-containing protein [Bacteroidota bacterium]|nr:molybdenum cofactor synthesis domain-containing protein [Bacteroidota bacterium]
MEKIKIRSVNISEKKGTIKKPVQGIRLTRNGVEGDAHSGSWHRQVSMLGKESIEKFEQQAGRKIQHGEFAENVTTDGILLYETNPFDRFYNDDVELEVTQIGKKCHGDNCAIFREVGNCVMPKEGIFARVLKSGALKAGDELFYKPKIFEVKIITLSDRASKGEYDDRSGPRIRELVQEYFESIKWKVEIENVVIPDSRDQLSSILVNEKESCTDVVITTGGTGIGSRDFTPEVVRGFLHKEIPGIMDMIRMKYGLEKPNALLSRSVAGVMGKSLVYALPGSVKAVNEYMTEINKSLQHVIFMLHGLDVH